MTRDERRREQDPIWWHQVRARLARIKVAKASKRVEALERDQHNRLEQLMLRRRLATEGNPHDDQ